MSSNSCLKAAIILWSVWWSVVVVIDGIDRATSRGLTGRIPNRWSIPRARCRGYRWMSRHCLQNIAEARDSCGRGFREPCVFHKREKKQELHALAHAGPRRDTLYYFPPWVFMPGSRESPTPTREVTPTLPTVRHVGTARRFGSSYIIEEPDTRL